MQNLSLPSNDWHHIALTETDSTMLLLRTEEMRRHPSKFLLVTADYQTAGRGQRGTSWEADEGKNLLFGIAVRPTFLKPDEQFRLSEITALAIAEALDSYTEGISVKWPNDIYWNDKKICGMLLEHDLSGGCIQRTIIGPGINVNQPVFRSDAPNPVSLCQIVGHDVPLSDVLSRFLRLFDSYYAKLEQGEQVDTPYYNRLYRADGRFYPFTDAAGPFEAKIEKVYPDGRLQVMDNAGSRRCYAFKEIQYVLPR